MTLAEQIMRAVAHLTQMQGYREFSREDVRRHLNIDREIWNKSLTAVFQGMREDHPGGAPPIGEPYSGVFRRVRHGRYTLTNKGQSFVEDMGQ